MDTEDVAKSIQGIDDKMGKILDEITTLKINKAEIDGSINTLTLVQNRLCIDFENLRRDVEPAMFLSKYPGIAKAATTGVAVMFLLTLYMSYNTIIANKKEDGHKIEQFQTK